MTVQHLAANDFESPGGRIMKLKRPGLFFVMFKTAGCPHCVSFTRHFEQMSQQELRVKFAFADVGRFRQISGMAQTTNTPIRAVPMFILYLNGAPFARYKGKHDPNNMIVFLNTMITKTGMTNGPSNFGGRAPPRGNPRNEPNRGIGMSQQELRAQKEAEAKIVPEGVIPYNAAYMAYLPMGQQ